MNAAFTAFGVAVTVGHALLPLQFFSGWCMVSIMGKKMASSGFFACFWKTRL